VKTPKHVDLAIDAGIATVHLNRPDRLNALTFDVYRELKELFDEMSTADEVRAVVLAGRGRGFCSGGDQDDIIAQLFSRDAKGLLDFTRMTGALVGAILKCKKPVIAAIHGVAVGAGAVIACASDVRIAADDARFGFIFPKVGLCGADMGAGLLLTKIVGRGHALELLFRGELIDAAHAYRIGLVNRIDKDPMALAHQWARDFANGPVFAHTMTKTMMLPKDVDAALEAEAQAQAICMQHPDFRRAHDAFKAKKGK
jgi:enoyl-CoA hydratase/carnithine racemase